MPQTRMRMRPWLEKQINSNKIPGLSWINKEEKLFQIPWKHAAKHGWDLEKDACLFKNWAIHTGRYKEGDVQPDPKTWKANFRCAMNSLPDIEEVKDKSISKGSSAVRVYRMLEPSAKIQKKEKKSKSLKARSLRRPVEDIKEETVEATNSIQLPDDHSGYVLPNYSSPEMEVGSTLDLSTCDLSSTDWRHHSMDIQLPDSTNDMYQLQVSPVASSSEATDDEDNITQHIYPQLFNNSTWQQTCVGEKGFLINEPGMQSIYVDLTLQDQDVSFDATDLLQLDTKNSVEFSFLDSLRIAPIPCGM
ncbi:interferon regulatory factor 1 [Sceloporus undulatus]|uniref:interferon regulatory factor 1 n=1 Tax=Sceloporus undulatus TaxID=8520 RepID=UPI001C4AD28B|nr:interferon regulatory factor 1 [Sceloporus undulatus]